MPPTTKCNGGNPQTPYAARLVGAFHLFGPDGAECSPRSRRARALVAYLILTPPHVASRETLATLLWSERGEEQARASLRQALFELRPLVGPDRLLTVTRSEVGLKTTAIATDLDAFDRAAACGDLAALATAFGAPDATLLADMRELDPVFDEWLAHRRSQWRDARRAAALEACKSDAGSRAPARALRLAQLAALADPLDEAAAVAAMTAAHWGGDIATIRQAYATLTQALRRELGVAPSPASSEAYRQLVESPPPVSSAARATGAVPGPILERLAPMRRRLISGRHVAAAIALAGLMTVGLVMVHRPSAAAPAALVVIEPLTSEGGDRVAQALSAGLSSVVARDLVGTNTQVRITDGPLASNGAKALVLNGQASAGGGEIHASIRLSSGQQHALIWSSDFDRRAGEVDQMVEQVALQVARELHCAFGGDQRPDFVADFETARLSLAACDAVGIDFDEVARYSAQVVARAPQFARGWAEYAAAVAMKGQALPPGAQARAWATVRRCANRAIALDRHQGLAYFALALTQLSPVQWAARERILEAGLAADRNSAEVNSAHAYDLAGVGRLNDALTYDRQAFAVDHFLPGKLQQLAANEIDLGELEDAQRLVARGETLWPHHPWFDELAWQIALHWGDVGEAQRLLARRDSVKRSSRRDVYAAFLTWRVAPSRTSANRVAMAIRKAADQGGADAELVQLMALVGRIDDAYALTDRLHPSVNLSGSWFQPDLARFRADPRFMTLAARFGLGDIWQRTGLWPDFCANGSVPYDCKAEAARARAAIHAAQTA